MVVDGQWLLSDWLAFTWLSLFFFFFFLRTPAVAARLWNHGDGGEREGLRSICYHCEIMIAQPLVTSSGWTLITLLIHVCLIWTDYWSYLYCTTKKFFLVFFFKQTLLHLPLTFTVSLHKHTLLCYYQLFSLGVFWSNMPEKPKSWGWKIALVP